MVVVFEFCFHVVLKQPDFVEAFVIQYILKKEIMNPLALKAIPIALGVAIGLGVAVGIALQAVFGKRREISYVPQAAPAPPKSSVDHTCPVCYSTSKDGVRLPCDHRLCKTCMQLLQEHSQHTCPICRREIPQSCFPNVRKRA